MSFVKPIRSGVRAFGYAVTSIPDTVVDGVAKMGDGIGKMTKSVLGVCPFSFVLRAMCMLLVFWYIVDEFVPFPVSSDPATRMLSVDSCHFFLSRGFYFLLRFN